MTSRPVSKMPKGVAELLPKAKRQPVALTQNGRTAAFLVDARDYHKMTELAQTGEEFLANCDGTLTKEEERALIAKADAAIARGDFIGDEESRAFIDRILNGKRAG